MKHPPLPDYSKKDCWALICHQKDSLFDVFYLYPTFFQGEPGALMDIYTTRLTPFIKVNILKNTGIFSGQGNIYAPLYRQASFSSLSLDEKARKEVLLPSLADAVLAFEYYLKHYNNGRPFVLAGHSQGSRLLRELIKLKFNNSALQKQLIAAYLLGAEVTLSDARDFPWLKLAQGETDTGVVITYNTQAEGVQNSPIFERGGAVGINPLTWSQDYGSRSLNSGAVFFDKKGYVLAEIPSFTDAYIDSSTGALITPLADMEKYSVKFFQKGVFHIYDYEFFYRNLQNNFKLRLKEYLSHTKQLPETKITLVKIVFLGYAFSMHLEREFFALYSLCVISMFWQ